MAMALKVFSKVRNGVLCASKTNRLELGKILLVEATKKKILDFTGFAYNEEELACAMGRMKEDYKKSQLVAFCLMLGLPYDGEKDELIRRLYTCLNDLQQFKKYENEQDEDEEDVFEDESKSYHKVDKRYCCNNNESEDGNDPKDGKDDSDDENFFEEQERRSNDCKTKRSDFNKSFKNKIKIKMESISEEDSDECSIQKKGVSKEDTRFSITYKDVEDSIRRFNGKDTYPVQRWIADFEEMAKVFKWNSMHKFVFAKRSLTGTAKTYIQSLYGVTTWEKLKKELLEEFGHKVNAAELHRLLSGAKLKKDESGQEFFIRVRELASRGKIEDDAVIDYIVEGVPVYYMSKKTTVAEEKYSSYELEVLAIVEALKKLRVYLLGINFTIITDCSAFQKTMEKRDLATRVARWALLLEEFDYKIVHRPGIRMKHADALSRFPLGMFVCEDFTARIRVAQEKDEHLQTIVHLLNSKEDPDFDGYFVRRGVLYKFVNGCDLLVVPRSMENEITRQAHEKGHYSVKPTEERVRQEFFIPKLSEKTANVVSNCITCILGSKKAGRKEGWLHPIDKGEVPLHTYHVDHLGPLETTNKNYNHIFAVVDGFSKFVWLYPTKSTTSKEVIAKLEIQEENKRTYNLRRREAQVYKIGDLVAIKRVRLGPGTKLRAKFLGPYSVIKIKPNNAYDVKKEGNHEGPQETSTTSEYMKPWTASGAADDQAWPSVRNATDSCCQATAHA